ncbi:MAG TPA: hypothetical protein VKD22_00225, partial [Ramlibacter sp.]|nr:hypothetical protein [Ramlibacter sp.]
MNADHEGEPNAIEMARCCLCDGPVGDSRHVTCVPASLTEPDRVSWTCNACAGPQLSPVRRATAHGWQMQERG